MAYYTPEEIKDILRKLSKEPPGEVNYVKFERMGVLVNPDSDEDDEGAKPKVEQDEGLAHVCAECKKKLISAHLLDLHVSETHDSYFDLQKDKKPMYACYLEECNQKSSTPEERKDHCIRIHKFPHDFRYDRVSSKKKAPDPNQMDTTETSQVSPPTSSKPKLMNFHFGHKTQKVFKTQGKRADPLESMVVDLKESLPE